jgi:putative transposase
MTRLARMVVSGLPHHVTQRGNRREPIFFEDGDQEIYRDLLGEQVRKAEVEVWAYCLMPNPRTPNPESATSEWARSCGG